MFGFSQSEALILLAIFFAFLAVQALYKILDTLRGILAHLRNEDR